jgi:DNA invertase Pin-like site-specific DNA recombinase
LVFEDLETHSQMLCSICVGKDEFRETNTSQEGWKREASTEPGHADRLCTCFDTGPEPRAADRGFEERRMQEDLGRQDERKPSGAPRLAQALDTLRNGDTLAVWKLDRLGRSVKHLVDLVGELQKQGVQFKSLTDSIDTGTASGRFFFHVMASLAEMERELIVERTRAGLEIARQLGRTGGRKRQMTDGKIKAAKKLLSSGVSARDVASNLGVSVPTLYRWVPASTHG